MTAVTAVVDDLSLGQGLYSVAEAARILSRQHAGLSGPKVRRWLDSALTFRRRHTSDGHDVVTFHDLVSLELVARFRERGTSLQKVHTFEQRLAARYPDLDRPFAYEVFYTDGAGLWAGLGGADPEEMVGKREGHWVWRDALLTFADEISYDPTSHASARWTPAPHIELDPRRQFGRPVVAGTRTPVDTVVRAAQAGTVDQIAGWYGLTVPEVEAALAYGRP